MPALDTDQAVRFNVRFEDSPPITLNLDLIPLVGSAADDRVARAAAADAQETADGAEARNTVQDNELAVLNDKTADLGVTRQPGPYVAAVPAVAAIAAILNPDQATKDAVLDGSFDFSSLVFAAEQPLTQFQPSLIVGRVASAERNSLHLYRIRPTDGGRILSLIEQDRVHDEGGFSYYDSGEYAPSEENIRMQLQKRSTVLHNEYHGQLSGAAVDQVTEIAQEQAGSHPSVLTAQSQEEMLATPTVPLRLYRRGTD